MKYIKPKSMTWWASFAPLALGVAVATQPVHGADVLVEVINNMTDGMSPYSLINFGLAGIGLRGAMP